MPPLISSAVDVGTGLVRDLRQPLYDLEVYPGSAGAATLTFFSRNIGSTTANTYGGATWIKNEFHTNQQSSMTLGKPNSFDWEGVQVEIEPTAGENVIANVIRWGVFTFYFGTVKFIEVPLSRVPAGVSLDGPGANTTTYLHNGLAAPGVMFDVKVRGGARKITYNETYYATITFPQTRPSAYADFWIRVYLLGELHRQM